MRTTSPIIRIDHTHLIAVLRAKQARDDAHGVEATKYTSRPTSALTGQVSSHNAGLQHAFKVEVVR